MKRYWKTLSIAILIVLTIGIFYIQSSLAKSNYPDFFIETKSGDEEIAKNLTVSGRYVEKGKDETIIDISADGTSYINNFSYIELLLGKQEDKEIIDLQNKYRSFMRGKEIYQNFAENEDVLAYADLNIDFTPEFRVNRATFEVEILEKDSEHQLEFSAPISIENKTDYLYITHVNISNDVINIFTEQSIYEDDVFANNTYVYRLDMSTGKLLGEQKIDFLDDYDGSYPIFDEQDSTNQYVLLVSDMYGGEQLTEEDDQPEKISQEMVVYNMEENEQKRLELPEEINLDFNVVSLVEETIYLRSERDDAVQIIGYNMESEQIETNYMMDLNQRPNDSFDLVIGEYVATVSPLKSNVVDAVIKVAEIKTGNILYEGSIEINPEEQVENYELDIHNISIN